MLDTNAILTRLDAIGILVDETRKLVTGNVEIGQVVPHPKPWPEFPEEVDYPSGKVLIDCRPPNGDYVPPDLLERLKVAAGKAGMTITVVHGSSTAPGLWDANHGYGDVDILYQDTPEATARMLLAIIDEFPIQRSTLPNPTPRQRLSAATSELSTGNHDTHVHVPLAGGQMILSPDRRREVLDAASKL